MKSSPETTLHIPKFSYEAYINSVTWEPKRSFSWICNILKTKTWAWNIFRLCWATRWVTSKVRNLRIGISQQFWVSEQPYRPF